MFHTLKKATQTGLAVLMLAQPFSVEAQSLLKQLERNVSTNRSVDIDGSGVRLRGGAETNAAARINNDIFNGQANVGAAAATDIKIDQQGARGSVAGVAVGSLDGEVKTDHGSIPVHADATVAGQVDAQVVWDNNRPLPQGAPVIYHPAEPPVYYDPVPTMPAPPPPVYQPPPPVYQPAPPPPIAYQPAPPPVVSQPPPPVYVPPISQPAPVPFPEPVYEDGIEKLPAFQFPKASKGRKLYSFTFDMKKNPKNFDKDEEILLRGHRIVGVAMYAAGDPRSRVTLWLDGKKVGQDRQSSPGDRTAATKTVSSNQEWYIWDVPSNQISTNSRMKIEFWKDDPKVYAVRVFYENEVEIRTRVEVRTRTIIKKIPKRYLFDVANLFEKQLGIIYEGTSDEHILEALIISQELSRMASVTDDSDASIGVSNVARELLDWLHPYCNRGIYIRAHRDREYEQNYLALGVYVWKMREHLNYYNNCPQYK